MTKWETTNLPTVWKNEKFSLTEKIFRENNSLATSLVKTLLSRSVIENFRNFHTVLQERKKIVFFWGKKQLQLGAFW